MAIDLEGAVACVTGAARGIGRETARLLAEQGAQVWIGDIDAAVADRTARELGVRAHRLDVTDPASFQEFLAAPGRPVSMLVNNAGVMHVGRFVDLDVGEHLREIAIDLTGVVIGMRLVLPTMMARNTGHIVNVASMAGKITVPGAATYNASKSAVVALSRAVRAEIAHTEVTVSTVLPSAVRTELTSGLSTRGVPTLDPVDVAAAIVDSARSGRREIVLPRWVGAMGVVEEAVPEAVMDRLRGLVDGRRLLDGVNHADRAGYIARS
ncbi:SDR family NAD(P)-dependent oxidoreductase [Nocardia higoensis]|uniref:SDR family NAD(P)-dependent oxidoreductase n=1 Tax=Nocardia higoensis TaxID=228599 RepID=A0ABS0D9L1_9NOCA|nr:SDR family NAD(P)-dependent oxidoreductase [Nocardia higoensis]MBF6355140.1 SDR family NAD(P)-dependent oxidoreductase [Nocardia higoensis]